MRRALQLAGAAGWAAVGASAAVGFAAVASVGLAIIPASALLAAVLLVRRVRGERWALLGAGVAFGVIGLMAVPWQPCTEVSPTVSDPPPPGGSSEYSCGGVHPGIWFAIGFVLAAAAVADAVRARRRS